MLAALITMMFIATAATAAEKETPKTPMRAQAYKDADSGAVVLSNDRVRIVFHAGQPLFDAFPKGFTGYSVLMKDDDAWTTVARAAYFSSYVVRTKWGRDWLHYPIPSEVELTQDGDSASVLLRSGAFDLDRATWNFTFRFTLRGDASIVETESTATPSETRELLLFWGPRLYVGDGTFGAAKDEALFPGLEYLDAGERSSNIWALAPDAQMNFVPHPAKVTIPLMTVVHENKVVGLMWDPRQPWLGAQNPPSALFASPNWLESKENHLLGLFLPSVPDFVPENGLRASQPVTVPADQTVSLKAQIFAIPGQHATDAIQLYLDATGGLPPVQAVPRSDQELAEFLTSALLDQWNEDEQGWAWTYGDPVKPLSEVALTLLRVLPIVKDPALVERAQGIIRKALEADKSRTFPLALLVGNLEGALVGERKAKHEQIANQQADGSWVYNPTELAQQGLAALLGPPEPGVIGQPGTKSQGITAQVAFSILEYALFSGDQQAYESGLRALADIERYTIPFPYLQDECPQSPSLHGSWYAVKAYLSAWRIDGNPEHVERAKYWARTGLPFIYLWSLPAQEVKSGHIHTSEYIAVPGSDLYDPTLRDPMLYASLYGYGSSQFMHHWFALVVQWIGMVYADSLHELAPLDDSLDWSTVIKGLLASSQWQNFEQKPYAGYFPDAFNLMTWTPSGPAFSPAMLLKTMITCSFDRPQYRTTVLRDGTQRWHLTSAGTLAEAAREANVLRFELNDPDREQVRAVVSGLGEKLEVRVDGAVLEPTDDLEATGDTWKLSETGHVLFKLASGAAPRRVEIAEQP